MNPLAVSGVAMLNFVTMLIVALFMLKALAIRYAGHPAGQALGVLVAT